MLLNYFHPIGALLNPSHLTQALMNPEPFCTSESFSCQRSSSTQKPLHAERFCTEKLLDTDVFTQKSLTHRTVLHMGTFCTEKLLQTEAFSKRSFLHRAPFTHRMTSYTSRTRQKTSSVPLFGIAARAQAQKVQQLHSSQESWRHSEKKSLNRANHFPSKAVAAVYICVDILASYIARTYPKYILRFFVWQQNAQCTCQYDFVPQALRKALASTTSYYKTYTKYFPVLLHTSKHAQSTSQYFFAFQDMREVRPSTILHHKLAQNTYQYYFVQQSLHKRLPSNQSMYSYS